MTDNENEDVPLVEGDDDLDVEINPVEAQDDPEDGDPDNPGMDDLPPESLQADPDDNRSIPHEEA